MKNDSKSDSAVARAPVAAAACNSMLSRWIPSARKHLYAIPGQNALACYGMGASDNWCVQTNQKAFAALAVLSADPGLDEVSAGMGRDEMSDWALKLLRFSLRSHEGGEATCTDGKRWGPTWISPLGIERMMHGVEALSPRLTPADHEALRRVLTAECDWLADHYPLVAHPSDGAKNHPESNLWIGCLLHRTALMVPDSPRASVYRERGTAFLVNSISIPSDAQCTDALEGRRVSDWHVGANFFESFSCNHHGYLNVGYMVICLSNIALFHLWCRAKGLTAPAALSHHAEELWGLVKAFTFPDGRLARIGGDTRVRYCYCQDYALPVWLWARERFGDAQASAFEEGWLALVDREQRANGDGAFLSKRGKALAERSPVYYTRLESDRAMTLSFVSWCDRHPPAAVSSHVDAPPSRAITPPASWSDEYHGACFVRTPRRLASVVWRAAEGPQVLCLDPGQSDLAEWRRNLAGDLVGIGQKNRNEPAAHRYSLFEGGFLNHGLFHAMSANHIAEGSMEERLAEVRLAVAALPDGHTVLVIQHARAMLRAALHAVKGVNLCLPNDLFNGSQRVYQGAFGTKKIQGGDLEREEVLDLGGNWVNVDDRLGLVLGYGEGNLQMHRPAGRQLGLVHGPDACGSLHADSVCAPCRVETSICDRGEVLFDLGCAVSSDEPATQTRSRANSIARLATPEPLRALKALGRDGHEYLLVLNLAETPVKLPDLGGGWRILASDAGPSANGKNPVSTELGGNAAILLQG